MSSFIGTMHKDGHFTEEYKQWCQKAFTASKVRPIRRPAGVLAGSRDEWIARKAEFKVKMQ